MSDIAIKVENLSKQYRIGASEDGRAGYKTLRESLVDAVGAPFRRAGKLLRGQAYGAAEMDETIWALKDVSFQVERGEVVGIIGRNGAGKTTLLKVLSRITEPTEGRAVINGRVGSLLEVGTGFHPELTGRENIYLNGAILGMTRAEIDRKFDEIVAFSGVEKFIDTPVKHYSSGMRVRLAFSVAAHLEPEILLVDEVLAVGDVGFQKKCLGKMGDVAKGGRTVLFVSHNMVAIQNFTNRTIYLDEGHVVDIGRSEEVVPKYLKLLDADVAENFVDLTQVHPVKQGQTQILRSLELISNGRPATSIKMGDDIAFRITYSAPEPIQRPRVSISIESERGDMIVAFGTVHAGLDISELHGNGQIICKVGALPLNEGTYYLKLALGRAHESHFEVYERVCRFQVHSSDVLKSGRVPNPKYGFLVWPCKWYFNND